MNSVDCIPKAIANKFINHLYTIEYDGIIGGNTTRLFACGKHLAYFTNITSDIKVWKSIDKLAYYFYSLSSDIKCRCLENNPVIMKYTYDGQFITKEVVCLLSEYSKFL